MGVRKPFSRAGKNFQGDKNIQLTSKHIQTLFSSKKVEKHTILAGQWPRTLRGGKEALALPP
jgi:hypothetical protein